MVLNQAKVSGAWFWNGVDRHRVHAREERVSEGGRIAAAFKLMVQLVSEKRKTFILIASVWGLSMTRRKMKGEGVGPRPEPLPQTRKDRVYEWVDGVMGENGFKNVNIDGGFDIEKVCMGSNGDSCDGIFQLRFGRPWKGNGRFRPFRGCHGLLVVCPPQVVPSVHCPGAGPWPSGPKGQGRATLQLALTPRVDLGLALARPSFNIICKVP